MIRILSHTPCGASLRGVFFCVKRGEWRRGGDVRGESAGGSASAASLSREAAAAPGVPVDSGLRKTQRACRVFHSVRPICESNVLREQAPALRLNSFAQPANFTHDGGGAQERQRQGIRQHGEDPGTFRRNGRAAGAAPLIPACREGRELAHRSLRPPAVHSARRAPAHRAVYLLIQYSFGYIPFMLPLRKPRNYLQHNHAEGLRQCCGCDKLQLLTKL